MDPVASRSTGVTDFFCGTSGRKAATAMLVSLVAMGIFITLAALAPTLTINASTLAFGLATGSLGFAAGYFVGSQKVQPGQPGLSQSGQPGQPEQMPLSQSAPLRSQPPSIFEHPVPQPGEAPSGGPVTGAPPRDQGRPNVSRTLH